MVSPFLKQLWTVLAVLINMYGQGILLSYTTSLLPALKDPNSPIQADLNTASWLSSCIGIAGIPGFLFSSTLMDILGRKKTHILIIFPGLIGWILIYFAKDVIALLAGRILGGMTAGGTVSLGAIAIGEYTDPRYRGMFLNLKTAAVCLGGMTMHIFGNFLSWRTIALICLVPHITSILMILTWPESPSWLAAQQQYERCEKSFYWLRGKTEESTRELSELIKAQMARTKLATTDSSWKNTVRGFLNKFTQKDFYWPLFINFVSAILLEMCGRHIFPAYALQIIEEVTGNKAQSFYFTLALDLIITSSAIFSSVLVRIMKRRSLLFSTGFAACFVLFTVCTYLFLAARDIVSKNANVPIVLFVIYFILANLGCTPIPLALLGELYPLAHRGVGSAVSGISLSLWLMVGLQSAPHLLVSIKVYGTFAVYGLAMCLALIVLYFTLPETKDRTLQEIEDYFNNGKFKDDVVRDDDKDVKTKMIS